MPTPKIRRPHRTLISGMWDLNLKVKSESGKIPLEKRIPTECEADPRPQDAAEWAGQKLGWAADAMQARHLN